MINGKRARMTRRDAERQESSAAGKQLPNVFGSVSILLFSLFFVRVGGSLPEQTEDVMKLNARVVAHGRSLSNHSLGASGERASKFTLLEHVYIVTPSRNCFPQLKIYFFFSDVYSIQILHRWPEKLRSIDCRSLVGDSWYLAAGV